MRHYFHHYACKGSGGLNKTFVIVIKSDARVYIRMLARQQKIVSIIACDLSHTSSHLHGFRCVTIATTNVWQTAHPQCVWRCLWMKTCRYINHNSATGQCELGLGQCEYLQPAVGIMVNAFGPLQHDCIYWRSSKKPEGVPFRDKNGFRLLARLEGGHVPTGSFNEIKREFWTNLEGEHIGPISEEDQDVEILIKEAACSVPWRPYTTGKPRPLRAVMGGRLPDGSTTYVAKVIHNDEVVFCYHNSRSALAYYEFYGPQTATSMDILVLLWSLILSA